MAEFPGQTVPGALAKRLYLKSIVFPMIGNNQDTDERGYRMTTRSAASQKAVLITPGNSRFAITKPEQSSSAHQSGKKVQTQHIIAGFLNPNCEHDWTKLAVELQTLESEGKTIWRCRTCAEITNTYSWQEP